MTPCSAIPMMYDEPLLLDEGFSIPHLEIEKMQKYFETFKHDLDTSVHFLKNLDVTVLRASELIHQMKWACIGVSVVAVVTWGMGTAIKNPEHKKKWYLFTALSLLSTALAVAGAYTMYQIQQTMLPIQSLLVKK